METHLMPTEGFKPGGVWDVGGRVCVTSLNLYCWKIIFRSMEGMEGGFNVYKTWFQKLIRLFE